MLTTYSAQHPLIARNDEALEVDDRDSIAIVSPRRERDAWAEVDALRSEIERLVRVDDEGTATDAVESALEMTTRLQVVEANIDACGPPTARLAGAAMVKLADARLHGHADAIERGMTYTADNQMRLLQTP